MSDVTLGLKTFYSLELRLLFEQWCILYEHVSYTCSCFVHSISIWNPQASFTFTITGLDTTLKTKMQTSGEACIEFTNAVAFIPVQFELNFLISHLRLSVSFLNITNTIIWWWWGLWWWWWAWWWYW